MPLPKPTPITEGSVILAECNGTRDSGIGRLMAVGRAAIGEHGLVSLIDGKAEFVELYVFSVVVQAANLTVVLEPLWDQPPTHTSV